MRELETAASVIAAARQLIASGRLSLPLPGHGATTKRFTALAELAANDLALARIAEGHTDAIAILAEASARPQQGLYGVWAADAGDARVVATRTASGWRLTGRKRFCSGAHGLDRALVTAGDRLFDVPLTSGVRRIADTWLAVGMATTDSGEVEFDVVLPDSAQVGDAGFYLERPGFWHGAVGVAACWYGGALGAMRMLAARKVVDDHQLAHLGAVVATCEMMRTVLDGAAREIDASSGTSDPDGKRRALVVRHLVEHGCQEVLTRSGRGGGTSPLVFDRAHAHRAADLAVYLRQHHAERDLAELGRLGVR